MQSRFDSISFYLIFRGNWCRGRYLSLPYFRAFRIFTIALLHRITLLKLFYHFSWCFSNNFRTMIFNLSAILLFSKRQTTTITAIENNPGLQYSYYKITWYELYIIRQQFKCWTISQNNSAYCKASKPIIYQAGDSGTVTAVPQSNYAWSYGKTGSKSVSWSMH